MKAKYHRKNKTITNLETGETKSFESVNKAKKASRELQIKEGKFLGCGILAVVQ